MKTSSSSSRRSAHRQQDDGYNTADSTIGIQIVGPAETEGPVQVPVDGTLDGSHAGQGTLQEDPISSLLFDHRLDCSRWDSGYLTPDYQLSWSPVSSPPCSPPPRSAGSTPDFGFSGHEFESTPPDLTSLSLSEEESDNLYFQQTEERLSRREQALPALILQESPHLRAFPDFAHPADFDKGELAQLKDSVVDQNSPSVEQLLPSLPPLSRSISDPAPSRRGKRRYRAPTPLLLPLDCQPLTCQPSTSARRSQRRVSSGSPYPSPHSSPSSPSCRESILPQLHLANSTSSMDDKHAFDRVTYRHASTSTSSLTLPPHGLHASTSHAPNYSPEHRPQLPSVVQRTLARANRRRSRSISPFRFDGGSDLHARRPSSRSRSDATFAQVPGFLTQPMRNIGCGAGASSLPTPLSSSLPKGYRLRGATFDTQPVVYAGSTQRPSSMVRDSSGYDEVMSNSSGERDIGHTYGTNSRSHEDAGGRRTSISSSSSSLSSELSLPPPPHHLSHAAHLIEPGVKHVTWGNSCEDEMAVDSRGYDEASDIGKDVFNKEDNAEEDRLDIAAEKEKRRSSYSYSSQSPKNLYGTTQSYGSTSHLPSPSYTPSTLCEEVLRTPSLTGTRSQSPSPSGRGRVMSHPYTPLLTQRIAPPTPASASTSKLPIRPVRRSRRLSSSPARQGRATIKAKFEPFEQELDGEGHQQPRRGSPNCRTSITTQKPGNTYHSVDADPEQPSQGNGNSAGRSRNRDMDYTSYRPHQRPIGDTDNDEDAESGSEYDEDDKDYCERRSYRGRGQSRRRGGSTKRSYCHGGTRSLQGSPLKGSILHSSSPPSSRDPDSRTRAQSVSGHPRARSGHHSQTLQCGSPTEITAYAPTASVPAAPGADAATTAAGIADAAVSLGGTIISGVVGVVNRNHSQYQTVGSKNIDNASEKRRKGEKRFKCRFKDCSKLFTTNQNRQIHQWKHTGEKPYCCQCGYGSASRSDLQRHLKRKNISPDCRELPVDQEYLNTLAAAEDDN